MGSVFNSYTTIRNFWIPHHPRLITSQSFRLFSLRKIIKTAAENSTAEPACRVDKRHRIPLLYIGEQKANMGAAAELRKQIESALAGRIPAALSPRPHSRAGADPLRPGGGRCHARRRAAAGCHHGADRRPILPDAPPWRSPPSPGSRNRATAAPTWISPTPWTRFRPPLLAWSCTACSGSAHHAAPRVAAHSRPATRPALRATDLLLNAGGFRALVLDLGDLPPEQTRRIPLATWYRFRLQAEKSRTLFLLITCAQDCAQGCAQTHAQSYVKSYAQSCAAVTLHCRPAEPHWRQAAEHSAAPARRTALPPQPGARPRRRSHPQKAGSLRPSLRSRLEQPHSVDRMSHAVTAVSLSPSARLRRAGSRPHPP